MVSFETIPLEIEVVVAVFTAVEVDVGEFDDIVLMTLELDVPVAVELARVVHVIVAVELEIRVAVTEAVEFILDVLLAEYVEFPEFDPVLAELIFELLELVDEADRPVIVELVGNTVEDGYNVEEFEDKELVIELRPVPFSIPVLVATKEKIC